MPKHKQVTVEAPVTERFMGRSDTNQNKACFAASPIYMEEITDDERREAWQTMILDGPINDGGHTFGVHDPNYLEAPDPAADVETGGGGLPASPFVPNPASPGPGSHNPADIPDPPEGFGQTPADTWGSGVGSQLSPKKSSERTSAHTLGEYILGRSAAE